MKKNDGTEVFHVTVDYTKSIAEMVRANNFDWVNNDVTDEHFPVKGSGQAELEFKVHDFGGYINGEDAIAEADKMGFRVAEPIEGLVFAVKYPDEQRKNPIVVLGSPWQFVDGIHFVLLLCERGSKRRLTLLHVDGDGSWYRYCRFLLVRK